MSFTPQSVREKEESVRSLAVNHWQRRAMVGMLGMVLLTFAAGNLWALLWQSSDWLAATVLPSVVIDLTNDERQLTDVQPLSRNPILDEAARQKAEHMAEKGYFAHYSPGGVSPWHWFREVGYQFAYAGENLAVHFTDSRAVVQAWMDSPSHRENIENENFTEIGVGTARGQYNGFDTIFVVQMFGTPAAPAADQTPSPSTELSIADEDEDVVEDVIPPTASIIPEANGGDMTTTISEEEMMGDALVSVGGAGADPVEVLVDERSIAVDDDVTIIDTENQGIETDTVYPEYTQTETTLDTESMSYLVHEDDGKNTKHEVVYWLSTMHATSSGLSPATTAASTLIKKDTLNPLIAMSTKPGALLQFVYLILALVTAGMILWAMQLEIRRQRYVQAVYSIGLLVLMGGLWYVHEAVTAGVVIA